MLRGRNIRSSALSSIFLSCLDVIISERFHASDLDVVINQSLYLNQERTNLSAYSVIITVTVVENMFEFIILITVCKMETC